MLDLYMHAVPSGVNNRLAKETTQNILMHKRETSCALRLCITPYLDFPLTAAACYSQSVLDQLQIPTSDPVTYIGRLNHQ